MPVSLAYYWLNYPYLRALILILIFRDQLFGISNFLVLAYISFVFNFKAKSVQSRVMTWAIWAVWNKKFKMFQNFSKEQSNSNFDIKYVLDCIININTNIIK